MSLVFNIFPDYVRSNFVSYTPDEIPVIPQLMCPKLLPQLRKLLKYFSCRNTLHYLNYLCRRETRRCFEKNMDMILHHLHRVYLKLILLCYSPKDFFNVSRYLFSKYMLPIFWRPNQVIFQIVDSMLCPSNSHAVLYQSYSFMAIPLSPQPDFIGLSRFHPASKLAGIQRNFL